ncbi:MAG: acylneuraminate cytidylyltransferase family protein [Bacteroidales bacterium]|nr:acylneuraminate cytidylyltransferase family protein [Bacteroidales bacterium]
MKVVAFVPIKLNNERLPGKNTKAFPDGTPLISCILQTLKNVEGLDEIYVYCSSEEICRYIPEGVKFLKRDPYLDLSTTPFNEVLTTFAERVEADVYVLTHATAPFISTGSFETGIRAVAEKGYDSALAVQKMQEFLWKEGKPFNYSPDAIPRTQDLEPMFVETCGMYIYNRDTIKKDRRRIGNKPFLVEVSKIEATDINNPEDFDVAEALYVKYFAK